MNTVSVPIRNNSSLDITLEEMTKVADALQIQVDKDLVEWGVNAKVFALNKTNKIPFGSWPIYLIDNVKSSGLGVHLTIGFGLGVTPYANVIAGPEWSLIASHELIEMLTDPKGSEFEFGPSIDPNSDGHTVNYLREIADPCEKFTYSIDGVKVSDFVNKEYYNENSQKKKFDFLDKLTHPYHVPNGCYISWIDPVDNHWHQKNDEGKFVTGKEFNQMKNPREDRDSSFGKTNKHARRFRHESRNKK